MGEAVPEALGEAGEDLVGVVLAPVEGGEERIDLRAISLHRRGGRALEVSKIEAAADLRLELVSPAVVHGGRIQDLEGAAAAV
jgi:hypothetical protein